MIKIRLAQVQHKIKTKQELIDNVMTIWASFTPGYIQCLYNTIPDRLQAVIKAKGHATKYWKIQTTNSFNVSLIFTTLFYCSQYSWRQKNVTHLWHGTVGQLDWQLHDGYRCPETPVRVDNCWITSVIFTRDLLLTYLVITWLKFINVST